MAIVNLTFNNTSRKVFLHLIILLLPLLLTDYFDPDPVLPLHLVVHQTKILSSIFSSHRGEVQVKPEQCCYVWSICYITSPG